MKALINYDRYGYCIGVDEIKDDTDIEKLVAAYHNRQLGYIDNLSGSWTIEDAKSMETIERNVKMNDCAVAWANGMDRCQCGMKDCPYYDDLPSFLGGAE